MASPTESLNNLSQKYDVPTPRYTSFPSVPYWTGITPEAWERALITRVASGEDKVSLYVHVPYCRTPCAFCGCTKVISKDKTLAGPFIETLLTEARQKIAPLPKKLKLVELHVGGGTPTWLSPAEMESLFLPLVSLFDRDANEFSFSIEVDPRTLSQEHVQSFHKMGVTRVSLGVQDFHEPTLKAIHREQSFETVTSAVRMLRDAGITAINFDLVYGLPFQTPETILQTLDAVAKLHPTRIAYYAYAHVPTLKAAQKFVEKSGIPVGPEKQLLADTARHKLNELGYEDIGFDHFALPDDELTFAFHNGSLHRNFMGYTAAKSSILLGLGPSSLSDCGTAYAQNEKDPTLWEKAVQTKQGLITRGHLLSSSDLETRKFLLNLMCQLEADIPMSASTLPNITQKIEALRNDQLIQFDPTVNHLKVSQTGRIYLRNIAASFDPYLLAARGSSATHSRA